MGKYDDIINLPRPESKRPRMPLSDRAAQFSPFAALSGHDESIRETARLTESQIELDDSHKGEIGRLLTLVSKNISLCPEVNVRWYQPDNFKLGGAYRQLQDRVVKIDTFRGEMTLATGDAIPLEHIVELATSEEICMESD